MSVALDLYAKLTETTDEKERARLIAEAFDVLEARFPQITDLATQGHVRESELRLQKEIKGVELQIREVEARLQKEIKEVELRLQKEIGQIRVDVEQVRVDLKATEANLRTAMHRQTVWIIGAIGAVTGLIRLLDWLLA